MWWGQNFLSVSSSSFNWDDRSLIEYNMGGVWLYIIQSSEKMATMDSDLLSCSRIGSSWSMMGGVTMNFLGFCHCQKSLYLLLFGMVLYLRSLHAFVDLYHTLGILTVNYALLYLLSNTFCLYILNKHLWIHSIIYGAIDTPRDIIKCVWCITLLQT